MIYLDNAATTSVLPEACGLIQKINAEEFFNPSAVYSPAVRLKEKIESAKCDIKSALGAAGGNIIFTSGATEANNIALSAAAKNRNGNVVISAGEHASVYEYALYLKGKGIDLRIAPLNPDGTVSGEKLLNMIDKNTALVSVIHVSNETGAVNDAEFLSKEAKKINENLLFHSDGVQAFCKLEKAPLPKNIDLYTVSAHKIGGQKGTGALYYSKNVNFSPALYGGGQEYGIRAGTENTAGILSFALASQIYYKKYSELCCQTLRKRFLDVLCPELKGLKVNANGLKSIISLSLSGLKAEVLSRIAAEKGVYFGLGSACAGAKQGNRVLSALGLTKEEIAGSFRISFGIFNTFEESETAAKIILEGIKTLCKM